MPRVIRGPIDDEIARHMSAARVPPHHREHFWLGFFVFVTLVVVLAFTWRYGASHASPVDPSRVLLGP